MEKIKKTGQNGTPKLKKILSNSESAFVEETLNNKNYEVWLVEEDIINIARIEYGWYDPTCRVLFEVIGSEQYLKDQLRRYQVKLEKKQSVTFIINLSSNHWATLAVFTYNDQLSAYYIDSVGNTLPEDIDGMLKNVFPNIYIKVFEVAQQNDDYNCGIFALINAKTFNDKLQNKCVPDSEDFSKLTQAQLESTRKEFAESLHRREKIERKFQVLLKNIEKLNKHKEVIGEKFNHQTANIVLFFLETVALQDLELHDSKSHDLGLFKYQEKILDQGIIDKEDLECVRYIRTREIFHRRRDSIIDPSYFDQIANFEDGMNIKTFFFHLERYVHHTYKQLKGRLHNNHEILGEYFKPKKLFKSEDKINEERTKNENFNKRITLREYRTHVITFFENNSNESYEHTSFNLQKANECLFDFVTNVAPFIEKVYKNPAKPLYEIQKFRDKIIHRFYDYGDDIEHIAISLKKFIRESKHYFFKYYYSQKVLDILNNVGASDHAQKINDSFKNSLKIIQDKFGSEYLSAEEDIDKDSYEFVPSEIVHAEISNKVDLEKCIKEFLKLMCVIDCDNAVVKREQCSTTSAKISRRYLELSSCIRREIYDDFKTLRNIFVMKKRRKLTEKSYSGEEKRLRIKLNRVYGILYNDFYRMVNSFVKDNKLYYSVAEKNIIEQIITAINALVEVKKNSPHYFSNRDIIQIFNNRHNIGDVRGMPEKLICSIPENTNTKIRILSRKGKIIRVKISTDRFIINMFEMFSSKFVKYNLVFDNIEEAFNDEIFLVCLANENINIDRHLLGKLLEMDYTAPYIARILTNNKLEKGVLKDVMYEKVVDSLLNNNKCMRHLRTMLETNEKIITSSQKSMIYEKMAKHLRTSLKANENIATSQKSVTCEKNACNITGNKSDIDSMRCIFDAPCHINQVLTFLLNDDDSSNNNCDSTKRICKEIIKLMNSIARSLYEEGNYDQVLKLFETRFYRKEKREEKNELIPKKKRKTIIQSLLDEHILEENDFEVLQVQRTIARTKMKQEKFEDMLAILEGIKDNILHDKSSQELHTVRKKKEIESSKFHFFLLVSSDTAYANSLLKNRFKAYRFYDRLYKDIVTLSGVVENTSGDSLTKERYELIKNSEKYKNIFTSSLDQTEILEYLDILKVRSEIARALAYLASQREHSSPSKALDYLTKSLCIYNEVYELRQPMYKNSEVNNWNILDTLGSISVVNNKLGKLKFKDKDNSMYANRNDLIVEKVMMPALDHHKQALEKLEGKRNILVKEKWETHPVVKESEKFITITMCHIANIHREIGILEGITKRIRHYEEAISVYKKAYELQRENLGEHNQYTLSTKIRLAYLKRDLGWVKKSKSIQNEAFRCFEEAYEMFEQVHQIQKTKLGDNNEKTKITKKVAKNTKKLKEKFRPRKSGSGHKGI